MIRVISSLNEDGAKCPKCDQEYGEFIFTGGNKIPVCRCGEPVSEFKLVYKYSPDSSGDKKHKDAWTINMRLEKEDES